MWKTFILPHCRGVVIAVEVASLDIALQRYSRTALCLRVLPKKINEPACMEGSKEKLTTLLN